MAESKKITTVTIGIPAYNEEANIKDLLDTLISQREVGFIIEEILVVSDGSTDRTVQIAKDVKDGKIRLIESDERKGKPARINEIFANAQSDIVVILDADIELSSGDVIKNLVIPLIDGRASYSSGFALPLSPVTFVQKIAFTGVEIWNDLRRSEYASSAYFSEGSIRAFKRSLYKEIKFPDASADDIFPFLYCAQKNYNFVSVEKALVYYKLPETFSDYLKQNKRFIKSKDIQECSFDKKLVEKYYTIGFKAKLIYLIKNMIKNPFWTTLYFGTVPLIRTLCIMDKSDSEAKWEVISSSKKIKPEGGKKKIIFSSYDSMGNPYYNGGGALAIHEVAKRLAAVYDVAVICGNYPSAKKHMIDGVSYVYAGFSFLGPKMSQLLFQILLPLYVIRNDFDIWIESFTPPFSTSFLTVFTKKPVIGLVHMLAGEDMARKYKLPFHIIESAGVKKYKNFIVSTEESVKKIRKINPRALFEVIPNGVESDLARIQRKKMHFLYMGRIEIDQKGLDLLLEGYKSISGKSDYPLVIAGAGLKSEEKKLAKMVRESGISEKVQLLGRVDGPMKAKMFREAVAVIIPSRFETFSLTALEALAYGVPVISFDIEGLKWLPEDFSRKVKPFDIEEMSRVMIELSQEGGNKKIDPDKLKIFLKDYDWNSIAEKYEKCIVNIMDRESGMADINSMVKKIISNKIPCVFISPHLDDAVLSSGALLLRLASKTETTVVTVFTEAQLPPYTFSTRVSLKNCGGHRDAQDLFRLRKSEDIEACEAIGARHIHLGFQDASFRKKDDASSVSKMIGKLLPEAEHIYPIYRLNIISGRISKNDGHTLTMLEKKLRYFRKKAGNCIVFCPLGVGRHVDHIMVREVCRKVFPTVVFWEDYPYNLELKKKNISTSGIGLGALDAPDLREKKIKMISFYKSQIKPMFPDGITLAPENYYFGQDKKAVL